MQRARQSLILGIIAVAALLVAPVPSFAGQLTQETTRTPQSAPETAQKLQQLVAPIALYPDALVAQILAASTYPAEIVQADRWLQGHSNLQGEQLAAAVDQQSWDPSVKALTAFPTVLANLDNNLSWTAALGEAYFSQQQDVIDAVQVMRRRAQEAGHLRTTPQERIGFEGSTILIEPVASNVCYLPLYDPWLAYGAPLAAYPGYSFNTWVGRRFYSFGPAIGLGFFSGFGWGWPAWGFNWGHRVVVFHRSAYISRSHFFFRRGLPRGTRGVLPLRSVTTAVRVDRGLNPVRTAVSPRASVETSRWSYRVPAAPRAANSPRPVASFGVHSYTVNQGSVSRAGSGGGRPRTGGSARSVSGGSRGGGGGRHR